MIWPYGEYSRPGLEEAQRAGFKATFTIQDKSASIADSIIIPRCLVVKNPTVAVFRGLLSDEMNDSDRQRALQADIDLIYDPDPEVQKRNIDAFIERVFTMKVNTVYLQAFCDDKGNGNIESVYFPNSVLPMKADLFAHIVNQLFIRGIQVYAWMPMLSIVLPDEDQYGAMRVREMRKGALGFPSVWYEGRLSPFHLEAQQLLETLYSEMAAGARISGVIFQDDGYLNDFEDFSEPALKHYRAISGDEGEEITPYNDLDKKQKKAWIERKTETLTALSVRLKEAVLVYRPQSKFARTLYAPVLADPKSEEWFAQSYAESLKTYDYVVIMSYPYMEKIKGRHVKWFERLVADARGYPSGLRKTIFKVQTYDWEKKRWIATETVDSWLRTLVAAGAWHVAYYPDNYLENKPEADRIRIMMSKEEFPFQRRLVR